MTPEQIIEKLEGVQIIDNYQGASWRSNKRNADFLIAEGYLVTSSTIHSDWQPLYESYKKDKKVFKENYMTILKGFFKTDNEFQNFLFERERLTAIRDAKVYLTAECAEKNKEFTRWQAFLSKLREECGEVIQYKITERTLHNEPCTHTYLSNFTSESDKERGFSTQIKFPKDTVTMPYNTMEITYMGWNIFVVEHTTNGSIGLTSHGWKLQFERDRHSPSYDNKKYYKTAKGLIKALDEAIESYEAKQKRESEYEVMKEAFLKDIREKYPNNEIDSWSDGTVRIELENGAYVIVGYGMNRDKDTKVPYKYWVDSVKYLRNVPLENLMTALT